MIKIFDLKLFEKVKQNDNCCLCTVEKTSCICEEFKKQDSGLCACKAFIKIKGE